MSKIGVGLSLMPTSDWRSANQPLFDAGEVDVVEWSLDFGFDQGRPTWVDDVLGDFEKRDALVAHGVEGSLMSATLTPASVDWQRQCAASCRQHRYRHLSEHYGFINAGRIARGTPFPCPPSRALLQACVDRWKQLADLTGLAVGVENLAFAFSPEDARQQADFVAELVFRSEGFLLLDVHNLWCQLENHGMVANDLLARYPLDLVREVHVAGGSYLTGTNFRRDTHDAAMPNGMLALVQQVVRTCKRLQSVILERTDRSLFSQEEAAAHRLEFRSLRALVAEAEYASSLPSPEASTHRTRWPQDELENVETFQAGLLESLRSSDSRTALVQRLHADGPTSPYAEYLQSFTETASRAGIAMAKQWTMAATTADEMVAAVFRGADWPLDFVTLPIPAPEPGQVLLRTRAVGLCGTDLHIVQGRFEVPAPLVLGHETVGEVLALGEGVTTLAVGDRVGVSWVQAGCNACSLCRSGRPQRCSEARTWIENGGGLSEFVVAEASGCTKLPNELSFEQAAPMMCGGHVALSAIHRAQLQEGEQLGVLGIGGIGHLALQLALAKGIAVEAISARKSKAGRIDLGTGSIALRNPARDELEERFDAIVSTTSDASVLGTALHWLRPGGRLVVLGLGGQAQFDPAILVPRELSVLGSIQGPASDLLEALSHAAAGRVQAQIETFPFPLVQRALDRLAQRRVRFRAVITF
jgi:D-arabinose 1-dehydrogenase-like Zn-dependent alcohol dehydrogenase/uncharacterized protein (UPF0276 family)